MIERRGYERYNVRCALEYRCEQGLLADSSVTLNLSERGALISTRHALKRGMRLIVRIVLDGLAFFLRSRVAHVERKNWISYKAGIEFLDAPQGFMRGFYREFEKHIIMARPIIR